MNFLKTVILTAILAFSSEILSGQQIPNAGFEQWELANTWTETPVGWQTQNGQLIQNTVRDSLPNSGDWAMRVYPIPDAIGAFGYAKTIVEIAQLPSSLEFYAKWQKTSTAGVYVELRFINAGAVVFVDTWNFATDSADWTQVNIPISNDQTPVTQIEIIAAVQIGDFAAGEGWIAIDDMSFDYISGTEELQDNNVLFSPNPCDKALIINIKNLIGVEKMVVYDAIGHLVYFGPLKPTYDTSQLTNGRYFIQFGEGEKLVKEQFQVQH